MELDENIELKVKVMIMEIMIILYKNDINQIHMGGLLRLLGVEEEVAKNSDNEYVELTEEFAKYIHQMSKLSELDKQNQILH
jgi:hypothetical protein